MNSPRAHLIDFVAGGLIAVSVVSVVYGLTLHPEVPLELIAVPAIRDLGDIYQGTTATVRVTLENGHPTLPATIVAVQTSCSCTAPKLTDNIIHPRKKLELNVDWNTKSLRSKSSSLVVIKYRLGDLPEERMATFKFIANVVPAFKVEPASVAFTDYFKESRDLTVTRHPMQQLGNIVEVRSTHTCFRPEIGLNDPENGTFVITVFYDPSLCHIDRLEQCGLHLITDSAIEKELFVPISIE